MILLWLYFIREYCIHSVNEYPCIRNERMGYLEEVASAFFVSCEGTIKIALICYILFFSFSGSSVGSSLLSLAYLIPPLVLAPFHS